MKQDEFDLRLTQEMADLPPDPGEVQDYNPWQAAMSRILWGMALTTFRLEFFYLQYLLPLLGAALMYLGYRSLRRENPWFRLCWGLSGLLLAIHIALDILAATPVMGWIAGNPAVNWGLTWPIRGMDLLLLFALWRGSRAAFRTVGEAQPPQGLAEGGLPLLSAGSGHRPVVRAGPPHPGQLLRPGHHRPISVALLRQSHPVHRPGDPPAGVHRPPERRPGGPGLRHRPRTCAGVRPALPAGVFALTLAAIPPALWLGGRIPTGPAEPAAQLTAEQEDIRARLVSLGLPEDVAAALDGAELERCAQAEAVRAGRTYDTDHTDNETPRTDGPAVLHELGGGEAELSSWLLFLPEDQVRQIHFFRYRAMPDLHLQEQFSVDPSGNFHAEDYAGRLLWEKNGQTLAVSPEIRLAGGQTAEELTEDQQLWYELELHRLGHLHYSPSFSFSIPRGAEGMRGWIAYTTAAVPSPLVEDPSDWSYGDFWYVFLRHQERWLHYPFVSIRDLGGSRSAGAYGPIRSVYAPSTSIPEQPEAHPRREVPLPPGFFCAALENPPGFLIQWNKPKEKEGVSMRTIQVAAITETVAKLCIQANTHLPGDIVAALDAARQSEPWPLARETLGLLWNNLELAEEKNLPVCQDTGMACVFVELGQEVHIEGEFEAAIHEGVRQGYGEGYLRKSIVGDPLRRVNTGDNTPAAITLRLVPGDGCRITVAPKGFGSENMSRLGMLKPADGVEGVKKIRGGDGAPGRLQPLFPPSCWASVSAAPLTRRPIWPSMPCSAPSTSPTPTPSMPSWRRSCWRRSMPWASAPRASAAGPPVWACPLRPPPPTWPACPWR